MPGPGSAQSAICSNWFTLYLMKYTAKGINASNMLVKLKAIQIQSHSHCEKVKIKKIKDVYILMNRKAMD